MDGMGGWVWVRWGSGGVVVGWGRERSGECDVPCVIFFVLLRMKDEDEDEDEEE